VSGEAGDLCTLDVSTGQGGSGECANSCSNEEHFEPVLGRCVLKDTCVDRKVLDVDGTTILFPCGSGDCLADIGWEDNKGCVPDISPDNGCTNSSFFKPNTSTGTCELKDCDERNITDEAKGRLYFYYLFSFFFIPSFFNVFKHLYFVLFPHFFIPSFSSDSFVVNSLVYLFNDSFNYLLVH
jgi:hypothetical protein